MKAAEVDITTGEIVSDKHRIDTPKPANPEAMADVVGQLTAHFDWKGPVGVGFPGVIQNGVVRTAANLDKSWVVGAGKDVSGTVILLTLGTGIGSAIFTDGKLLRNTEFGHMDMDGKIAEDRASSRIKEEKDWSYKKWGGELEDYLKEMEKLFWPELFILGGGISKNFDEFEEHIDKVCTRVVPAEMLNRAGIVGAALAHAVRQP